MPRRDQGAKALPLAVQIGEFARQHVPVGGDGAGQPHELGEIQGEHVDLIAHLGQHGAEQHRGADRFQHVLRPHQHGGRRTPPHALQGGQDLGDHPAPGVERTALRRFASRQRAETVFDSPDAVFGRTHPFGGLDEGGAQPGPIGRNLGDLGLEPPAQFGARGDRLLDGLEVSLAPGLLLRCLMGARRRTVCRSCLRGTSALRPSLNLSGQAHPGQSRAKRREMGERSETPGRCQEHHGQGSSPPAR